MHSGAGVDTPPVTSSSLAELLADRDFIQVEYLLRTKFDSISGGQFEWLRDLKEAGYTEDEIFTCLRESAELSPWVSSSNQSDEPIRGPTLDGEISLDSHQKNCVHHGPIATSLLSTAEVELRHSPNHWAFDPNRAETLRRRVANCCGLAGIFPPDSSHFEYGYIQFDSQPESTVQIYYGPSKTAGACGPDLVYTDLVRQIWFATRCICSAVRILQDNGFCCDRLTMLLPDPERPSDAVNMRAILLKDVNNYVKAMQNLWSEMQATRGWKLPPQSLLYCTTVAMGILNHLALEDADLRDVNSLDQNAQSLHICALATQLLSFVVLSYSQAHAGDIWPFFLKEPLPGVMLLGSRADPGSGLVILISYSNLACVGDLVDDKVIVMRATNRDSPASSPPHSSKRLVLVASIEDIVDSWGPGLLISDPDTPYGERVHAVRIGGGTVVRASAPPKFILSSSRKLYHWSRSQEIDYDNLDTFNIRVPIEIGGVSVHESCALDAQMCRRQSESHLKHLSTETDRWELAERQMFFQGGQYVGLQVGNIYSKIKGRSLKAILLDTWKIMPDFRLLLQPWGLQMSLCTGVAQRVPLINLLQEPMFAYIDGLCLEHWDAIKVEVRSAFSDAIDYVKWTKGLQGGQRDCLIRVITFFLEVLKDTGVDREGNELRMLWPHETSLSHAISLKCNKCNLWARVLKDSPSCATFAAVTNTCLEAPGHECKKKSAPIWTGQGALLATAVSRVLIPGSLASSETVEWELKNGEQCWIEKAGGEIWVYTTKNPNSDTQLRVKINRFPRGLSLFREWQILRERQDDNFYAEEVVVFGTIS